MRPLNPYAAEWTPVGLRAQAGNVAVAVGEDDKKTHITFDLAGLPSEVITMVVSSLTDPRDVASCVCSCHLLKDHVHDAELVLDIRNWKASIGQVNTANMDELFGNMPRALLGLSKYMPGTVGLLLPNLPLEDNDLEHLVARLPRLQMLDFSGTRKLTHSGVSALTTAASRGPDRPAAGGEPSQQQQQQRQVGPMTATAGVQRVGPAGARASPRPLPLRFVNLQRCFQLHSGSLDELLAVPGLRGLALSHLDLGRWPLATPQTPSFRGPAAAAGGAAGRAPDGRGCDTAARSGAGLQVLVLNNCLRLHGPAIDALAAVCGGAPPRPTPTPPHDPGSPGARRRSGSDSNIYSYSSSSSSSSSHDGGAAAGGAPAGGGGVRFLLLGGSTLALSTFVMPAASSANSTNGGAGGAGGCQPPELPPRLEALLTRSYRPALMSNATTAQAHLNAARHLVAAVLAMPRLTALELTFFPQPLVHCVRGVLADGDALGRAPVEVWDFAGDTADDLGAVRRALRRGLWVALEHQCMDWAGSGGDGGSGGGAAPLPRSPPAAGASGRAAAALDELAVAAVLRCAVNCSSVTRSTPLHLAAERGNAAGVAALLAAGAVVDARDTAGSSPLFLASEAGHTAAVERLLAAGADPSLGNAAGETPLYIAALRGHLGVVKALLAGCQARGIAWQDPEMYGDAWTPLHAAAVANRADVAAFLLQAAGASGAGELVVAPNKYGQSVLHVAARKGSAQLLRLLLSAGGVAVVGSRDGSGDTPVDVAKKNRHVAALAEFRRLTGGHGAAGGRPQHAAATAMA